MHRIRPIRFLWSAAAVALSLWAFQGLSRADTIIDTFPSWNGSAAVFSFGYPNTATYGQTVTVPATDTVLSSFTFFMNLPATTTFNGEVFAWDGLKASGASLFESPAMATTGSGTFESIVFNTGGVPLVAGQQYVLFASVSKLAGSGIGSWGQPQNQNVYPGGLFVFLNNANNPSLWTTTNWSQNFLGTGGDLAFRAVFTSGAPSVPEPASCVLLGIGLAGMAVVVRRRILV